MAGQLMWNENDRMVKTIRMMDCVQGKDRIKVRVFYDRARGLLGTRTCYHIAQNLVAAEIVYSTKFAVPE